MGAAEVQRIDRESLLMRRETVLVRGGWSKADVWTARLPDDRFVAVKDFYDKPLFGRLWGWLMIHREAKLLSILEDMRGAPRLIGRVGPLAIALEYLDGAPLHRVGVSAQSSKYFEQLRAILGEMRSRGVIHNDLRGRENVHLVTDEDRIVVLDWAGGLFVRPGSRLHRWAFDRLRIADEAALVKWKLLLRPEEISRDDREFLSRFSRLRRLWPFNRKGLGRGRAPRGSESQSTK